MQADQYRVGLQRQRVADQIMAAGKIQHAPRRDSSLDRGGIVARAVAEDPERVDIDPVLAWWQRGNGGR